MIHFLGAIAIPSLCYTQQQGQEVIPCISYCTNSLYPMQIFHPPTCSSPQHKIFFIPSILHLFGLPLLLIPSTSDSYIIFVNLSPFIHLHMSKPFCIPSLALSTMFLLLCPSYLLDQPCSQYILSSNISSTINPPSSAHYHKWPMP